MNFSTKKLLIQTYSHHVFMRSVSKLWVLICVFANTPGGWTFYDLFDIKGVHFSDENFRELFHSNPEFMWMWHYFYVEIVMHSNLFVGLLDVKRLQCGAFQMLQNTDAKL